MMKADFSSGGNAVNRDYYNPATTITIAIIQKLLNNFCLAGFAPVGRNAYLTVCWSSEGDGTYSGVAVTNFHTP